MTRSLVVVSRRAAGVLAAAAWVAACGPVRPCVPGCADPLPARFQADPASPPAIVNLTPATAWTGTGIVVHKGDLLLFTASGNVSWRGHGSNGPDGEGGQPGWSVGPGGLVGRVGAGKPFDLGARTGLFPDAHARPPHHPYPPPAVAMPASGELMLGFKAFSAGTNSGGFEVRIQRATPAPRSTRTPDRQADGI